MPVTEISCMGVKPNVDIMDESTPEGQVLPRAWKTVTAAPGGPHKVYWSLQVEDPSKVWTFFEWDSVDDHEKFAKSFGGEAVKDLPTVLTHGVFTKHVSVSQSPPQILESPVTEVLIAYFPSDISSTAKDAAAARFQQFAEKGLGKCADCKGVSAGWGVENDFPVIGGEEGQLGSIFIAFVGWTSIDAHVQFRETEAFKENIHFLRSMEGLLKMTMFHVSCQSIMRVAE